MNGLIKVEITNNNGKLLVSSRNIAKGLDKKHCDVLIKIREVLNQREFSCVEYLDAKGEKRTEYLLDKNAFILLVMNYTGFNDFKRAYIKRFDEMEKELLTSLSKAPKSFKEALYLAYQQQEKIEKLNEENSYLEKTKAWISDKKTATALNTASQMSKKASKLEIKLDLSMSYATVKKVEKATGRKYDWRKLKEYCKSAGLGWNKAHDSNYGEVNSYPAEAWKNVYGVDLSTEKVGV